LQFTLFSESQQQFDDFLAVRDAFEAYQKSAKLALPAAAEPVVTPVKELHRRLQKPLQDEMAKQIAVLEQEVSCDDAALPPPIICVCEGAGSCGARGPWTRGPNAARCES
jgi:hypothetical protein